MADYCICIYCSYLCHQALSKSLSFLVKECNHDLIYHVKEGSWHHEIQAHKFSICLHKGSLLSLSKMHSKGRAIDCLYSGVCALYIAYCNQSVNQSIYRSISSLLHEWNLAIGRGHSLRMTRSAIRNY